METITKEKKIDLNPKCALCGREVTESDWCHGCHEFVCNECDKTKPTSNHKAEDHYPEYLIPKSLWE